MTIGERIRAARRAAGMTQAELAQKLGISYVGVSQWENGLRQPKYETLQKLADALHTTPSALKGVDLLNDPMIELSDSSKRLYAELTMCVDDKLRKYVNSIVENTAQIISAYGEIDSLPALTPPGSTNPERDYYVDIMTYLSVISKCVSEIDSSSHKMLLFVQEKAADQSLRHWKKKLQADGDPPEATAESGEETATTTETDDTEV